MIYTISRQPVLAAMLLLLLAASGVSAQTPSPRYDLLLKGGHVIDARNGVNRVADVAIAGGKIARISPQIGPAEARRTVDISGLYVVPGLIDLHAHVYVVTGGGQYAGERSVVPDGFTFRSGVTTVVDAGSSGWRNFPDFKQRIIDRSRTRVLAFLNIVSRGMEDGPVQQDTREMDPESAARCAREYPEIIVGFKTAHFVGPEWSALDGAIAAGKTTSLPVMVDYGGGHSTRPFEEALKRMRPGDMYTHFYGRPRPLRDEQGRIRPYFLEARKRGVLFDVGHGAGSFLFRQAVPAIQLGFIPDSISTDIHTGSMNAGMKDMLNVMSKFLNIGLSLQEVVKRSTLHPARQIKRDDLGHLSEGAVADIAVLRVRTGRFGFVDVLGAREDGTQKLEAELTIRAGQVVWDFNGITRDHWRKLPPDYPIQGHPAWDGTLNHPREPAVR